jgi:hypothetical protein
MTDTRGLVVSCPIEILANGSLQVKSARLDPQELRFALLFWDLLEYPQNNLIHITSGPEESFLESAGVLHRTRLIFNGAGLGGILFRTIHIAAFRYRDEKQPGVWSLATGERSISFPDEETIDDRGALVALHRAIPVPDTDVALQDILEFREKRRAELLALRSHLEGIYHRVQSAGDGELAWNTEVNALERALTDYLKASRGWGVKLKWMSFEAGLNLVGGAAATVMATTQGLPLLGALATGATAALALKGGPALKQREVNKTPFRYVSRFHDELFP